MMILNGFVDDQQSINANMQRKMTFQIITVILPVQF